ncbi:class I SAM-dependent methyltransferase [Psychrobacter sp. LV10R520-6]|uniref:class I SAM-dependent methyltransferase n=1 Tax=Psychrobacter sp. LV10R520-6 TaxID=1415574 RepID=UPI0024C89554|nr:class I SAM-dependent methyltransferase [Psychrobacter sp. LV10R520-6]SNT70051.1 Methyltransferase domain-containing protein [Psychrobacter sp. LV10R520-6]
MWDQRYNEAGFAYGTEANDFLKEEFHKIPAGGRVLCLAEGEGRNAVFLAQNGYQVTAMDLSEVGLNKALKLASDKGVEISTQVADLADYKLGDAQWDGIVSIWAHMPEAIQQRVHAQVAPALKPGGVFILEAYTYQQTTMEGVGGPPATQKDRFVSSEDLQSELAKLEEVTGIEKQRTISEGTRHQGLSAVVQFVGYKK